MNKKTVFIFLLGVLTSALVFGAASLVFQKPASREIAASHESLPASFGKEGVHPAEAANLPASSPRQAIETPTFRAMLSPQADGRSFMYEVKPGDTLTAISKKHGTTVDIIKRANFLASDGLRPGMTLKIPTYKFSLVVDKSQNTLLLKGDEEVLKTYTVSTGENNSTPSGVYKITDKLVNPTWYKAGAVAPYGSSENVLGTRWLGFTLKGYGIHGTSEPEKLGRQVTAGCIRMTNEEAEELFGLVPSGTEVTVVD